MITKSKPKVKYKLLKSIGYPLLGSIAISAANTAYAEKENTKVLNDSNFALEEILVTARRRAESLNNVPISISAFSESELENLGAERLQDIAGSTPNFVFPMNNVSARPDISVRGIFSNVRNLGFDTGVGVYLDGVFMGKRMSFNMDMADISQVEILRGPQGTLYGKNTIAGAINITSKAPGNELEGYGEIEVGNLDLLRIRAGANIPLIQDTLAMRLSVYDNQRDGYIDNAFDGSDLNNEDASGGRLQLLYTPTDSLNLRLSYDYLDESRDIVQLEPISGFDSDNKPHTVNFDYPDNLEERELQGASLVAEYSFESGYQITSVTGWRDSKVRLAGDNDFTSLDILGVDFHDGQEQFSQELRLSSPVSEHYDFVIGVFYFDQNADYNRPVFTGADFGIVDTTSNIGKIDTSSTALFAHSNINLTEALTLFVGARYTDEQKDMTHSQIAGAFGLFGLPEFTDLKADIDDQETSWTGGLRYQLNEDVMLYGSVAKGFKSGGFNADFLFDFDSFVVDPEFVTSYEIGIKSSWLENRIRMNLAAFYLDYEDLQVSQVKAPPAVGFDLKNAATATSQGAELELQALFTERLHMNLGVGYVDATFDSFKQAGIDPVSGDFIDYDGNQLARAPEWTANIALNYDYPLSNGGTLLFYTGYNYVDEQFTQANNGPDTFLKDYGILDARLSYVSPGETWQITAWGKNLNDKVAATSALTWTSTFAQTEIYTEPRTYGLTFRVNF